MNILVTGALGHIGSNLIREYANRKDVDTIRILDNISTQRYCSLFNLSTNKTYQFIEGDINDKKCLKLALKDIDVVIHLAAITDAPSTIAKPKLTQKVNFKGTENVLKESIKADVKKFIFPSTTSVYGEAEGLVDENYTSYTPSSPYAEAKLAAEGIVKNAFVENGFDTSVLRLGTIFGVSIGMRFHTAVNRFCYLAAMTKPLTVWENALDQKRPYIGLNDAIRAFEFIEKEGKPGELYNTLTENYTVRQIVDAIKLFKLETKIKITNSPILNQKSYFVSNKKITGIGFTFKDDLTKIIGETVKLFEAIKNE